MKYRYMGSTGLTVSRLTLGTMTFGAEKWGADEAQSHRIMKRYLDAGGNSLDCGDVYAGGRSEEIIGSFLPQVDREDVLIATKTYFPVGTKPNQFGVSRKRIIGSCEASLRRLKTDYVDLYYIHGPDPVAPFEEQMRALDDLVRQGKTRYVGCSNLFGWQIAKANGIAARMNLEPLTAAQHLYNLIQRGSEQEIIPAAVDQGLGFFTYSPLGGGLLTGKYRGMKEPKEGSRLSYRTQVDGPRFWHERGFRTAETVERISADTGIDMAKLAIAWPLKRKFVTSVVIGVRSVDQLESNLEMGDWDMPDDVFRALEEQTRPEQDYLTWFNGLNYNRFFSAAEFHNETADLP